MMSKPLHIVDGDDDVLLCEQPDQVVLHVLKDHVEGPLDLGFGLGFRLGLGVGLGLAVGLGLVVGLGLGLV